VLHHGDIPQETREVFEMVVRRELVKLAICTNTLAEGVNLPIRTMVLYSVRRGTASGRAEDLLARDIKNLVGRAGRAGSTTKGLVICANHEQWPLVERVARQENGERVAGALLRLTNNLRSALARTGWQLSNELLENSPSLFALVDGIDATVVDLAIEEVGGDELAAIAVHLADQTFAFRQLDEASKRALEEVFELRARRIAELRTSGRLKWIHETGARPRILSTVLDQLYTSWDGWQSVADSMDPALFTALLEWAWLQPELREAVRDSYRLTGSESVELKKASFFTLVRQWILGASYSAIAEQASLTVDETLAVHAKAVGYCLQMQIEQAVAILERLADTFGVQLAPAVSSFPSCLRFGVSSAAAVEFALKGVRHRRAAIELSEDASIKGMEWAGAEPMLVEARDSLRTREREWRTRLGSLVYSRTVEDVAQALRHTEDVQ
jgi:superfamily II RNA helicase